jgi:hypothetical protein
MPITYDYWYGRDSAPTGSWEETSVYKNSNNALLDVKHTFISFAQKYFENHSRFTWAADLRTTKLIVADKNTIELEVLDRKPGIILSRGPAQWHMVAGQKGVGDTTKGFMYPDGLEKLDGPFTEVDVSRKEYKDLIDGTVTFNCISANGVQAEEIANELFMALTAYKAEIYKHGIHMIHGISIGEESIIRSNADVELAVVAVMLRYSSQSTITTSLNTYNLSVVFDEDTTVFEGIHYRVEPAESGITYDALEFRTAPEAGTDIVATYADLVTLDEVVDDLTSQVDGTNTTFELSARPYGYYKIVRSIDVTMDIWNSGIVEEETVISGIWP